MNESSDKTKKAIKEALSGSSSVPTQTVAKYLVYAMRLHGEKFDHKRALDDLSDEVAMFKKEIEK